VVHCIKHEIRVINLGVQNTLHPARLTGRHDPCLQCGAYFVAAVIQEEASFAKHCTGISPQFEGEAHASV
jgi:hypothetical protein